MLAKEAEVVIIGAGIVGCATAYYLAKKGAKVVLLDKGEVGNAQSSRAWGFVRQQGRDTAEVPLMMACIKIWENLEEELKSDIEWVQGGNLALAEDAQRLQQFTDWIKIADNFGLRTEIVSPKKIKEMVPLMEGSWVGGMYTCNDGHAEPEKATAAFEKAARQNGAVIQTSCTVEDIGLTNGVVSEVVTDKGTIKTPLVICAAGASSTRIARKLGISLPQLSVRESVAETVSAPQVTRLGIWAPGWAIRQRPSGNIYIGTEPSYHFLTPDSFRYMKYFLPNMRRNRHAVKVKVGAELLGEWFFSLSRRTKKPSPLSERELEINEKIVGLSVSKFRHHLPSLAGLQIQRKWSGMIDATPDGLPVLGSADVKGFLIATGFSGHGFAMGPIIGLLMSELVLDGNKTSLDIKPMRLSRFKEESVKPRNIL